MGSLRNPEKDDELALFFEMRKLEKEHDDLLLLQNSDVFDAPLGSTTGSSPIFSIASTSALEIDVDDLLSSECDKNDYEWLISPPHTPLFPSLELELEETTSQLATPETCVPVQICSLSNPHPECIARSSFTSREATSPRSNISSAGSRRQSSLGGSKPSTPIGKPTLRTSSTSRPTSLSKPPSNATLKGGVTSKSSLLTASRSSREETPTSPAMFHSTSKQTIPNSRNTTRSTAAITLQPKILSSSSSRIKSSKNPQPQNTTSPAVKQRPLKPPDSLRHSLDASLAVSATRGRSGAPSTHPSPVIGGRVRRQSCSPARGHPPVIHSSGNSVPGSIMSRLHAKANTNVSPVAVGTKMVERVVNMRKLAPPMQDRRHSSLSSKTPLPDSLGFGRTISKKSLDMAMRHMDIRRSVPSNLRPLMTKIPPLSTNMGSGPRRKVGRSASEAPPATSSCTSSEVSVDGG